ncbi:Wadjet anti-phage system protein JetD domain-containing protein [Corynebacterium nuruki]|jgi:hypothetical protein|uniref:DUF3322 and DUF2220 domain-containing protein n=1 Tax=Corynebacterium nuruki TaxID=1032851 RepID=A0A3D4T1A4_9CORY|nr:hypothetical protein [Corynebacterium nuruki]
MVKSSGPLTPTDAVTSLTAWVERRWKDWLADPQLADTATADLPLHPPTGKKAGADPASAADWIRSWQRWERGHTGADSTVTVVWVEKSWSAAGLGRQRVPDRLQVTGVEALVTLTGQKSRWRGLIHRMSRLLGERPAPGVRTAAAAVMTRWSDLTDEDLVRLHAVVDWLLAYPDSGLTPRAVPVEGVHGKWLEHHLTLVTRLVSAHRGAPDGSLVRSLSDLGLVEREPQIRMRLPSDVPGRDVFPEDMTLTWTGAAMLWAETTVPVTGVLIVENLETFLALPVCPGRMLIWGAGYRARKWAQLPWLVNLPTWYWGDLDTDGFAILSAVRSHLPQVQSVLMDEAAVRRWRPLATTDTHPDRKILPYLTTAEDAALDLLASLGNLRIEQERILLSEAVDVLCATGFFRS